MKIRRFVTSLLFLLQMALLAGCGSSNGTNDPVSTLATSQKCISCHSGSDPSAPALSPVTGELITADWMISGHNTASAANMSGSGAGCTDCHGPGHNHPNDYCGQCHGGGGAPTLTWLNPATAGQCWNCHRANASPAHLSPAHFYNITGAGVHPAMYATKNFQNSCTACHEPHNPFLGKGAAERKAWAQSGHGNTKSPAFATEDFKNVLSGGRYACIRCHTSTGYSNFLAGGFTDPFPTTTWATPGDNGREVLTCRTCHVNYNFAVKGATAFTAPYNNNLNPKQFPDESESNLCIACHSGRESADTIEAVANFANASFKNSHYKAGAGLMFMAVGFWNYTTPATKVGASTRLLTMTPDNITVPTYGIAGGVSSTHRKLGSVLMNGDSHSPSFFVPGVLDSNGPCVTCHLNANGVPPRAAHGHTWQIDVNAAAQVCINCHAGEVDKTSCGTASQTDLANFLEENADGFTDALGLIQNLFLTKYNIKYDPNTYPYFYDLAKDPAGKTAVTDWTRGTNKQVFGKRMMGSAYNLNLLIKDQGAFAHARTYVRRLIYDAIDFLDDNKMNFSVGATAKAYDPVKYVQDTKAYVIGNNACTSATGPTVTFGTTTGDMVYLLGWNRTTGAWNTPERP